MERISDFKSTIEVPSGFKPKNGNNYPLMEGRDILVGANDERLDDRLYANGIENIASFKIQDNSLVISAGKGVACFYTKEVLDKNYADALFTNALQKSIIGANGIDTTVYHSGGTLYLGGTMVMNGIEFQE